MTLDDLYDLPVDEDDDYLTLAAAHSPFAIESLPEDHWDGRERQFGLQATMNNRRLADPFIADAVRRDQELQAGWLFVLAWAKAIAREHIASVPQTIDALYRSGMPTELAQRFEKEIYDSHAAQLRGEPNAAVDMHAAITYRRGQQSLDLNRAHQFAAHASAIVPRQDGGTRSRERRSAPGHRAPGTSAAHGPPGRSTGDDPPRPRCSRRLDALLDALLDARERGDDQAAARVLADLAEAAG